LGLSLQGKSHSVERLPVHIEGGQTVNFEEGATREEMQLLLENAAFTKLTAFFHLCELDSRARELLYHELPEFYCWKNGSWNRRRNAYKVIGRMYSVSPSQGERFYLRLLLCNVRGPRSYQDIRTYQGVTHDSFKDCAIARGLLEDDTEWVNCLQEAADVSSASQLRHLFSTILAHCQPANIATLYQQFYGSLSEDFVYAHPEWSADQLKNSTCSAISTCLVEMGKSYGDFSGLPEFQLPQVPNRNNLIQEEMDYPEDLLTEWAGKKNSLNARQRAVFDEVISATQQQQEKNVFFLDGPGGTGKTFLYNTILGKLRSQGKICLAVASSGIAAELLMGGRTAHSRFKIPIENLSRESSCSISAGSNLAQLLENTTAIIWDEAPLMHKLSIEAVDRSLKDMLNNNSPFGGITVLFGGDYRQVLPIMKNGSRTQIVNSSLKRSRIWGHTKVCCNLAYIQGPSID
jgi:hypothetical protein